MKKHVAALSIVLMMLIVIPVSALEPRVGVKIPTLAFNGTTATCKVLITGDDTSDTISATIKLYNGSSCIKTWNAQGESGTLRFEDTATVVKGKTYTLSVDAKINGKPQDTFSITRTCPT